MPEVTGVSRDQPESLAQLLIASRHLPFYTGGLASYQKGLATELIQHHRIAVEFLAAEQGEETPSAPESLPCPSFVAEGIQNQRAWMGLASRPVLHPWLQWWIRSRFRRAFVRSGNRLAASPLACPDVIHYVGTGWDFSGFGFLDLARRRGARFTIWPAVHPGEWGDDVIDLRLYRLADAVFCQSHSEAAHLARRGLEASKMIRCGLPPMCLSGRDGTLLRRSLNINDRPVVLFLGRRDKGKGYPALLEAWKDVLQHYPSTILLLSGPGGGEYEALKHHLPGDSFRDLGVADEETKAQALAACDVFCLPSAHESFGIVFAEAWSYGKPVICGPAPASREWVADGETGLHVDQTPASIAGAIRRLLADHLLRVSLGAAGLRFQQNTLNWDTVSRIHLKAWRGDL